MGLSFAWKQGTLMDVNQKNGRWLEEAGRSLVDGRSNNACDVSVPGPVVSVPLFPSARRDNGRMLLLGPIRYGSEQTIAWRQWVLFTTRWWSRRWKGSVCDHRLITRTTAGARHHRAWMHRGGSSTSTMSCVRLFRRKWYVR
jgi:hypothetical protein